MPRLPVATSGTGLSSIPQLYELIGVGVKNVLGASGGGPDRTRTDGLCDANAALSQLSYGPAGILAAPLPLDGMAAQTPR
jgi:hypothetical protein